MIADYKDEFIRKLKGFDPVDGEFPTMVVQTMNMKMLYPLGLRGQAGPVFYAGYRGSNLDAAQVMRWFLGGGTNLQLPDKPGQVTLDAYTVPKLIQLLQFARQRGFTGTAGAGRLHPELTGLPLTENLIKAEVVDPDSATLDAAENSPTYMEPNGYGRFRDPVLGPAWSAFEFPRAGLARSLQDGNDYFLPAADGRPQNFRLTDRFWHHVLQKYGYIENLP